MAVQGLAQVPLLSRTLSDEHGSAHMPPAQRLLQQSVLVLQVSPFGMHIGVVVVEVVLVDVEVVGVVVEVLVDVEVVLVEVLVVLLVDVLVEVVGVVSHGPSWSPWPRWPSTALSGTSMVFSAGVPGLWQMVTFCC
jgi:hypothetical protein